MEKASLLALLGILCIIIALTFLVRTEGFAGKKVTRSGAPGSGVHGGAPAAAAPAAPKKSGAAPKKSGAKKAGAAPKKAGAKKAGAKKAGAAPKKAGAAKKAAAAALGGAALGAAAGVAATRVSRASEEGPISGTESSLRVGSGKDIKFSEVLQGIKTYKTGMEAPEVDQSTVDRESKKLATKQSGEAAKLINTIRSTIQDEIQLQKKQSPGLNQGSWFRSKESFYGGGQVIPDCNEDKPTNDPITLFIRASDYRRAKPEVDPAVYVRRENVWGVGHA